MNDSYPTHHYVEFQVNWNNYTKNFLKDDQLLFVIISKQFVKMLVILSQPKTTWKECMLSWVEIVELRAQLLSL